MTKDTKGLFMKRSVHWTLILGVLLALTLGVAACGGDDDGDEAGTSQGTPAEAKKGGKLTALWASDVDYIDPGQTYYQVGNIPVRATQSPLYLPKVDDATTPEPILAESDPQVSEDGCTVTVKIKDGVMFSPPVEREVTSKDVKYAIERGFFNNVNTGYAGAYFGDVTGAEVGVKPGTTISGIKTPDDLTIEFDLKEKTAGKCTGGVLCRRARHAAHSAGPGGVRAQVRRGQPLHVRSEPGRDRPVHDRERRRAARRSATNPASGSTWSATPAGRKDQDSRPAYVDEVEIQQGNDDATVMSRKILEGESMINGDQPPTPAVLREAVSRTARIRSSSSPAAAAAGSR